MSSLPAAELQLQQAANPISLQSAGRDAALASNTTAMSGSAEGTAGQIEPASLNVDAEMLNSQVESLVQVASTVAWGFEMNAKGEIVAQDNPLIYEFDEDTPEFQADLRREMPWFDSNWSIMTIVFKPDSGQVSSGAAFDRDDARDWLKGQVENGRVRLHPDCSLAFLPGRKDTKRNYFCGEEVFGTEKLWVLRGVEVATDQKGYTNSGEFVRAGLAAAAAMGISGSTEHWARLDSAGRKKGTFICHGLNKINQHMLWSRKDLASARAQLLLFTGKTWEEWEKDGVYLYDTKREATGCWFWAWMVKDLVSIVKAIGEDDFAIIKDDESAVEGFCSRFLRFYDKSMPKNRALTAGGEQFLIKPSTTTKKLLIQLRGRYDTKAQAERAVCSLISKKTSYKDVAELRSKMVVLFENSRPVGVRFSPDDAVMSATIRDALDGTFTSEGIRSATPKPIQVFTQKCDCGVCRPQRKRGNPAAICWNCGKQGHHQDDCTESKVCFECDGKHNHMLCSPKCDMFGMAVRTIKARYEAGQCCNCRCVAHITRACPQFEMDDGTVLFPRSFKALCAHAGVDIETSICAQQPPAQQTMEVGTDGLMTEPTGLKLAPVPRAQPAAAPLKGAWLARSEHERLTGIVGEQVQQLQIAKEQEVNSAVSASEQRMATMEGQMLTMQDQLNALKESQVTDETVRKVLQDEMGTVMRDTLRSVMSEEAVNLRKELRDAMGLPPPSLDPMGRPAMLPAMQQSQGVQINGAMHYGMPGQAFNGQWAVPPHPMIPPPMSRPMAYGAPWPGMQGTTAGIGYSGQMIGPAAEHQAVQPGMQGTTAGIGYSGQMIEPAAEHQAVQPGSMIQGPHGPTALRALVDESRRSQDAEQLSEDVASAALATTSTPSSADGHSSDEHSSPNRKPKKNARSRSVSPKNGAEHSKRWKVWVNKQRAWWKTFPAGKREELKAMVIAGWQVGEDCHLQSADEALGRLQEGSRQRSAAQDSSVSQQLSVMEAQVEGSRPSSSGEEQQNSNVHEHSGDGQTGEDGWALLGRLHTMRRQGLNELKSKLNKQHSAADLVTVTRELQTRHAHLEAEFQKQERNLTLMVVPDGALEDRLSAAVEGFRNELNERQKVDEPMMQLNMELRLIKAEIDSYDSPFSGYLDPAADDESKLKRLQDVHAALRLVKAHDGAISARQYQHQALETLDLAIARSSGMTGKDHDMVQVQMSDDVITGKRFERTTPGPSLRGEARSPQGGTGLKKRQKGSVVLYQHE